MSDAIPGIKTIRVKPEQLLLDPSNPRIIIHFTNDIEPKDYAEHEVQTSLEKLLADKKNNFDLEALKKSIGSKGFFPVDSIFVEYWGKLNSKKIYLVLEGNRRTCAIKSLLREIKENKKNAFADGLATQLSEIEVKLIPSDAQLESTKIRLLGMRHHGSQKKWTPFARSKDAFIKYLEMGHIDVEDFQWDSNTAGALADSLTIDVKDLKEMLQVFVAMHQLHAHGANGALKFEIKDRFYSLIKDGLGNKNLKSYFLRDDLTFQLDKASLEKFCNLCDFQNRSDSPISSPSEWRPFGKIIANHDDLQPPDTHKANIEKVIKYKRKPSEVWSNFMAEAYPPGWQKWFNDVTAVLSELKMSDLPNRDNEEEFKDAAEVILKIDDVLKRL